MLKLFIGQMAQMDNNNVFIWVLWTVGFAKSCHIKITLDIFMR